MAVLLMLSSSTCDTYTLETIELLPFLIPTVLIRALCAIGPTFLSTTLLISILYATWYHPWLIVPDVEFGSCARHRQRADLELVGYPSRREEGQVL